VDESAFTFDPLKTNPLSVLFILIGISIMVAGSFLVAFLWNVFSGQYDDDYTPSVRMLFDNNIPQNTESNKITKTTKKNAGRKISLR
jgi:cbb3-type cytochrome oxidase maturation protein